MKIRIGWVELLEIIWKALRAEKTGVMLKVVVVGMVLGSCTLPQDRQSSLEAEASIQCFFPQGKIVGIRSNGIKDQKKTGASVGYLQSQTLEFLVGDQLLFLYRPWSTEKVELASELVLLDQRMSLDGKKIVVSAMNRETKKVYRLQCHKN